MLLSIIGDQSDGRKNRHLDQCKGHPNDEKEHLEIPEVVGKRHHKKYAEKMFEKMDTNNDGFVTRAEFRKFSNKKFKEMDTNKDGKLCKSEILDYKKNKKRKGK